MQKQPLEIQTLYAEFLEQMTAFEAQRDLGHLRGCFITKTVKGASYLYFQGSEPSGRTRQIYVGRAGPVMDKVVAEFKAKSRSVQEDRASLRRLSALLAAGGALIPDSSTARVLRALGEAGVFRLGGVLVGTHAFLALGNALGTRWDHASLATQDIDIAGERAMDLALPGDTADIPGVLESLQMGFLPVPPFNPRHPTTSFKIRGKALRLDLLTPAPRTGNTAPIHIRRFNAAAQPLPFLGYLIEGPIPAAVAHGDGLLVQLPRPGRFGLHKLILAGERGAALATKAGKDLHQAAQIIAALAEERPGDLIEAWDRLQAMGPSWLRRYHAGLRRLEKGHPDIVRTLKALTA
jgi:hypothetical protein